jgi:tetratricopeptide (TPR) repeat protein
MGESERAAPRRPNGAAPAPIAEWVREDAPRSERPSEPQRPRAPYALPGDVASEVRRAFIGTAHARERAVTELTKAAEAYDRHRYEEALRHARAVADLVPGVGAVRELAGLAAYRAERWAIARTQLRAHFEITGDAEHLPLLMDAERALRHARAVERVYAEVLEAEPSADVLAEARIVLAGAWADERRYPEAIDLLVRAGAAKKLRNPSFRHVRLWYALADVYDRAGDTTNARELFTRIVAVEPEAYDAAARLGEVGHAVRKNRKRRATPTSTKRRDD